MGVLGGAAMVKLWVPLLSLAALFPLGIASAEVPVESYAPEVDTALAELDQAGTPATKAEIDEYLGASASAAAGFRWLGRSGWTATGPDYLVRLRGTSRWLSGEGRWRRERSGARSGAAAVFLGPEQLQVAAGQLGLTHGFGLLVAGPGRAVALTADGGLAGAGQRLRPWTGTAGPQTVRGVAGRLRVGVWRGAVLYGRRGERGNGAGPTAVARLGAAGSSWRFAGLLLTDPLESGASLALRTRRGALETAAEFSWRRPLGSARFLVAWLAQGGWRIHRDLRVEVLAGWADPGPRPVMAQKHPVFGDWAGQGVAVRGVWRAANGLSAKLLAHRGQGDPIREPGPRHCRSLVDALLSRTWSREFSGSLRWREGREEVTAWSERFPWLPPAPAWQDSRRVLSAVAAWNGERGQARLRWRRIHLARNRQGVGQESGGVRSLLTVAGRRQLGSGFGMRAAWTTSWGDPVDLVSAVVPLVGYVLPRHWGYWRSEHMLGLAWSSGSWRGEGAISRRLPDIETGTSAPKAAWVAWAQGSWNW